MSRNVFKKFPDLNLVKDYGRLGREVSSTFSERFQNAFRTLSDTCCIGERTALDPDSHAEFQEISGNLCDFPGLAVQPPHGVRIPGVQKKV